MCVSSVTFEFQAMLWSLVTALVTVYCFNPSKLSFESAECATRVVVAPLKQHD